MATVVGLLIYALGVRWKKSYQLDSSKKLVKPLKKERILEPKISITDGNNTERPSCTSTTKTN